VLSGLAGLEDVGSFGYQLSPSCSIGIRPAVFATGRICRIGKTRPLAPSAPTFRVGQAPVTAGPRFPGSGVPVPLAHRRVVIAVRSRFDRRTSDRRGYAASAWVSACCSSR
jgi:hypothetical protein